MEHNHKYSAESHETGHSHGMHESHADNGHNKHAGHSLNDFWIRFKICVLASIPVIALSHMIQSWLGFTIAFYGDKYVLAALSTFIFFYGGWPFLKGLYAEVKDKAVGMMTLIAIAITVAWGYSFAVTFGLSGMDFYWEMATLIDIMLLGHYLEMKSIMGASRSLELLVKMMPYEAHLIQGENVADVKLEDIQKHDLLLVKPGEKVPADSEVISGESYINESMLTGESKPVLKKKHERVIAGSINGNGSLTVKVLHTGEESYLSKVINLVQEAQKEKSKTQVLADKAAKWLTFVALGSGIITLAVWLSLGYDFPFALERMVTVMVISCPHALGLAIPLVVAISTSISANRGLLIRNRTAFENSRKITTVIFDKTGTLTEGNFAVNHYAAFARDFNKNDLLAMAAALEANSEHPIAASIVAKAKELNLSVPSANNFKAITGKGIEAQLNGKDIKVVSPGYLKENNMNIPANINASGTDTVVYILVENKLTGYFSLSDRIREDSKDAVKLLHNNGIKAVMATGDNKKVAEAVTKELGLDGFYAEVLPHQKLELIKGLQEKGEFVAMAGDGINDAPALAQADVGIAVGSGTDVAAETADIILVNSNPKDIASLILFGKATYKKMIQNLIWATGYNILALPLAAGVLYFMGIILSPAIGAVLMSVSTIVVAINAQLLRRKIKN